ncbi:hypothetical protein BDR05DRAFT_961685, partial [Suillus weaverae]
IHVSTERFSDTEDQSVAPKPLGPTLAQSSASGVQVVINSPHKNTVKATSSTRPAPGPSSATATRQTKHTSRTLSQLLTPNASLHSASPISTKIMELLPETRAFTIKERSLLKRLCIDDYILRGDGREGRLQKRTRV